MSSIPVLSGCKPLSVVEKCMGMDINLVGVVADLRQPMASRGTDWTVTFVICDQSRPHHTSGISVRIFKPTMEELPQIHSNGDIIIIRSLRVKCFDDKLFALSSLKTSWVISYLPTHPNALPLVTTFPTTTKAKPEELQHIRSLRTWWSSIGGGSSRGSGLGSNYQSAGPTVARGSNYQSVGPIVTSGSHYQSSGPVLVGGGKPQKFGLIRDMQFDHFYDIVGLVVKTFPNIMNYTVYITDYTKHSMLHSYEWYGDSTTADAGEDGDYDYTGRGRSGNRKWPGPWGQYTLQVTLWDKHASAAREILREGTYVELRNVRAKRNGDGKLEGALHGDKRFPDRVDVHPINNLDNPRVKQVIQRGKEYTRRFQSHKDRHEQEMKVKTAELKKKEEKREAEKQARAEEGNKNVRCQKPSHQVTPISQILNPTDTNAPFVNRNYRIFCRVIDYLPKSLEDFSVPNQSSSNPNEEDYYLPQKAWVWRFALLVEGEDGASMRLIIEGGDAEYLLNLDAVDLRKDNRTLRKLREKLFVLWGNLEERITQRRLKETEKLSRKRNKRSHHGSAKKRRETDDLGKPIKKQDSEPDSDLEVGNSDEEGGGGKDGEGRGKMFEACVKEYGIPVGEGWKRMHRLFGTVIL